jgi:hypothetical protein
MTTPTRSTRRATPYLLPASARAIPTVLAACDLDVLAVCTRDRHPAPRVTLEIALDPRRILPTPCVRVAGESDLTLIEDPSTGRLRILPSTPPHAWIEVSLDAYRACIQEAETVWTRPLPAFSTVAIVALRRAPHLPASRPSGAGQGEIPDETWDGTTNSCASAQ